MVRDEGDVQVDWLIHHSDHRAFVSPVARHAYPQLVFPRKREERVIPVRAHGLGVVLVPKIAIPRGPGVLLNIDQLITGHRCSCNPVVDIFRSIIDIPIRVDQTRQDDDVLGSAPVGQMQA